MKEKSSRDMPRDERLKFTVIHEIGHYLLIKRYNQKFPEHPIFTYRIKIFSEEGSVKNGEVEFVYQYKDLHTLSTKELKELMAIDLAGFIAPTVFYDITYGNLEDQADYISAYNIAGILSRRFNRKKRNKKAGITKTADDIIREGQEEVKQYLDDNKETLLKISKILYESRELSFLELKKIDKEFNL